MFYISFFSKKMSGKNIFSSKFFIFSLISTKQFIQILAFIIPNFIGKYPNQTKSVEFIIQS